MSNSCVPPGRAVYVSSGGDVCRGFGASRLTGTHLGVFAELFELRGGAFPEFGASGQVFLPTLCCPLALASRRTLGTAGPRRAGANLREAGQSPTFFNSHLQILVLVFVPGFFRFSTDILRFLPLPVETLPESLLFSPVGHYWIYFS